MMASDASECRSWRSIADLLTPKAQARIGFLGAPLSERSLTPGRCDLAPRVVRETLKRFSVYDLETGADLSAAVIADHGDLNLKITTPADAFAPIRDAVRKAAAAHELTIVVGGNNAVTRPAVHGIGGDLKRIGLLTLDAHFDLRDTDCGLNNGNPVRALLEDGLPGHNIVQIGLAPFANTRRAHETAKAAGVAVFTASDCWREGTLSLVEKGLALLAGRCDAVHVDFDIDVIDRAQCPGAPGARPGGIAVRDFFAAARAVAAHRKVRSVDLAEFDPSLDQSDVSALVAGRWVAEIIAGRLAA